MAIPEESKNKMMVEHLYHRQTPLTSITLSRGQKGTYAYDIKVEGENHGSLIQQLQEIDSELKKTFEKDKQGETVSMSQVP